MFTNIKVWPRHNKLGRVSIPIVATGDSHTAARKVTFYRHTRSEDGIRGLFRPITG